MQLFSFMCCLVVAFVSLGGDAQAKTRTFFIAADEVMWSYAPSGKNLITGTSLRPPLPNRIGRVYKKAVYREYTDASFARERRKPAYLGILGPTLHAEVGDTIVVNFKNNTKFPQSMHPHGVFYEKASEGAPYQDGVALADKGGDSVAPGAQFRYVWKVPHRAGPAQMDGSSVLWMYHSHVNEAADISTGLIGPIIVTRKGMARADGSPRDVDRELVVLFALEDENQSLYMPQNVQLASSPSAITPADQFNPFSQFYATNEMPTINGYIYGNMPTPIVRVGQRVRWYLIGHASDALDYHNVHWHGNTATAGGMRTDTVALLPGSMAIADMVPDNPGTWLFHCHVGYHLDGGMVGVYRVKR